jgi:hypothetical protein
MTPPMGGLREAETLFGVAEALVKKDCWKTPDLRLLLHGWSFSNKKICAGDDRLPSLAQGCRIYHFLEVAFGHQT